VFALCQPGASTPDILNLFFRDPWFGGKFNGLSSLNSLSCLSVKFKLSLDNLPVAAACSREIN
jgi:hypothetical protein